MKLADLNPPASVLASARESRTLRDAWDVASRHDLMELIGKAHTWGTLPRRDLVLVTVRCVECVAHLLADESLPHLATVSSWANGADDVTREDLEEARRSLRDAAYAAYAAGAYAAAAYTAANAAAYAAYAAYAAHAAAADADAADAYVTAAYAYVTAADAYVTAAYAYVTAAYADADVIRDAITLEAVCAALCLDPDEVL